MPFKIWILTTAQMVQTMLSVLWMDVIFYSRAHVNVFICVRGERTKVTGKMLKCQMFQARH